MVKKYINTTISIALEKDRKSACRSGKLANCCKVVKRSSEMITPSVDGCGP